MSPPHVRTERFCRADELPEGAMTSRVVGDLAVAVGRLDGRLVAFSALCPHAQADLSAGWLEEDGVRCPHHLWHFELGGGTCTNVPGFRLPVYRAREEQGWIVVDLPP